MYTAVIKKIMIERRIRKEKVLLKDLIEGFERLVILSSDVLEDIKPDVIKDSNELIKKAKEHFRI